MYKKKEVSFKKLLSLRVIIITGEMFYSRSGEGGLFLVLGSGKCGASFMTSQSVNTEAPPICGGASQSCLCELL
jgi:hypothetical protein